MPHPHLLARHLHGVQRRARLFPGHFGPRRGCDSRRVSHRVRNPNLRRAFRPAFRPALQKSAGASDSPRPRYSALPARPVRTRRNARRPRRRTSTMFSPVSTIRRHRPAHEIHHHLSGGRGLEIMIAHRRRRIHNHHRKSFAAQIPTPLAPPETSNACRAPACLRMRPVYSHRRCRPPECRCIPPCWCRRLVPLRHCARGFEHGPRPFDVRPVHLLRLARPQPVVRGDVVDHPHPSTARFERFGIAQVTLDRLTPASSRSLRRIARQGAYAYRPRSNKRAPRASRRSPWRR